MVNLIYNETYQQKFIDYAIQRAKTYGYSGYNIDWEPNSKGSETDALR